MLSGGCLTQYDVDEISNILDDTSEEGAKIRRVLETLLAKKEALPKEDYLRRTIYDRRMFEVLWRVNNFRRSPYGPRFGALAKEQQDKLKINYCHNSKIIHFPDLYGDNPEYGQCSKIIESCKTMKTVRYDESFGQVFVKDYTRSKPEERIAVRSNSPLFLGGPDAIDDDEAPAPLVLEEPPALVEASGGGGGAGEKETVFSRFQRLKESV
jgi:hypothetical protein